MIGAGTPRALKDTKAHLLFVLLQILSALLAISLFDLYPALDRAPESIRSREIRSSRKTPFRPGLLDSWLGHKLSGVRTRKFQQVKPMKFHVCLVLVLVSVVVTCFGGTDTLATPLSIPFELVSNTILIRVGINGSAPTWFVLDSGASACVVDSALAAKLGLKAEGEKQGTGAGKGTVKISFLKALTYNLPGVDVPIRGRAHR
jgi:hypothetical protein